jgi:hypothetical protein
MFYFSSSWAIKMDNPEKLATQGTEEEEKYYT